ncbi:putative Zn-dependent protease [Sphingomonas zeicaulis]|uniref:M48 family metalloprotease n=1 Tax=Sphingomonas zeicaulis TaxID=1632740 RepID=UPI003D212199
MTRAFKAAAFLALLGSAAAVPVASQSGRAVSISQADKQLGSQEHPKMLAEFGGAYNAPQAAYVTRIGRKIAVQSGLSNSQGDFTVTLLNSPVNNAFAIPGGYVYITRQLTGLINDEAELASVMGHEVGHVAARHAAKRNQQQSLGTLGTLLGTLGAGLLTGSDEIARMAQQVLGTGAQLWVLGYSRSQEYEADDLGVRYLVSAGYDPTASSTMLASLAAQSALDQKLGRVPARSVPTWASTHPDPASRVQRALQQAKATGSRSTVRNRDAYLTALDGTLYDDDPRQGVIEGRTFRHPDLRLMFSIPQGFTMSNGTQSVSIAGSGGQAQFSSGRFSGDMDAYIGAVFQGLAGQGGRINYGTPQRTTINGIPVSFASAQANTNSGQVDVTVVAYRFGTSSAYHFVTLTPVGNSNPFNAMFQSLRRMSEAEAKGVRPRRISVVTVKAGDSSASLARRMAYSDGQLDRFLTLNAQPANRPLRVGQRVKLIVYG